MDHNEINAEKGIKEVEREKAREERKEVLVFIYEFPAASHSVTAMEFSFFFSEGSYVCNKGSFSLKVKSSVYNASTDSLARGGFLKQQNLTLSHTERI